MVAEVETPQDPEPASDEEPVYIEPRWPIAVVVSTAAECCQAMVSDRPFRDTRPGAAALFAVEHDPRRPA